MLSRSWRSWLELRVKLYFVIWKVSRLIGFNRLFITSHHLLLKLSWRLLLLFNEVVDFLGYLSMRIRYWFNFWLLLLQQEHHHQMLLRLLIVIALSTCWLSRSFLISTWRPTLRLVFLQHPLCTFLPQGFSLASSIISGCSCCLRYLISIRFTRGFRSLDDFTRVGRILSRFWWDLADQTATCAWPTYDQLVALVHWYKIMHYLLVLLVLWVVMKGIHNKLVVLSWRWISWSDCPLRVRIHLCFFQVGLTSAFCFIHGVSLLIEDIV
jgi:hypothetical protein